MELVNAWTLQKNPTTNPRISVKLICFIARRAFKLHRLAGAQCGCTCCHATGTCPSFKGHMSELVTEGSAWTVTGSAPWTKDYTLLGSPHYSPAITPLAWFSAGSSHAPGTPLLLPGLEEVGTVLGSGSFLTPSYLPPAGKDKACFVLQTCWMSGNDSVVWGLMLPIPSLELQTTRGNWEVPVPLRFGVLKLSQRRGTDEAVWVERHIQGITCQTALQHATRRCALEG